MGPPRGTNTDSPDEAGGGPGDQVLALVREAGTLDLDSLAQRLERPVGALLADVVRLEAGGRVFFDGATVTLNGH